MPLAKATGVDKKNQEQLIAGGLVPNHIAIIMDGNGRWAKHNGLPRIAGHNEGVNSVRDIVEACAQLGVKYLTLYTFSTENWKRPQDEVSMLMRLIVKALRDERDRLHQNEVRLQVIGEFNTLPDDVANELRDAMEVMRENCGLTLVLALSYSGRWDIIKAIKEMYDDIHTGVLKKEKITEEVIGTYLSTKDIPDPDLLIRTSGELRISNFLLWQLAYSEIYISNEFWPAFRREHLYEAIEDFQKRERRFGMVSEQLQPLKKSHPARLIERFKKSVAK
ncbi:MAG: isoprenyl transferase [Bacteroidota bacterium]